MKNSQMSLIIHSLRISFVIIYKFTNKMEMHCYIIIYDLRAPGRNYDGLYQAIRDYGTWGKISESAWAVVSYHNSVEIREDLVRYLDGNDRLMVIKSGQDAAWVNAMASKVWLQDNLVK